MSNKQSPLNHASSDLEKVAISRFRSLISSLPQECQIFRELWGRSTVLCLDFGNCPELLEMTRERSLLLLITAHSLGLADSLLFRLDKKVVGWKSW